ncbi:MAG: hypothetical protein Q9196_007300, partial [Gyalolechia fulgens]
QCLKQLKPPLLSLIAAIPMEGPSSTFRLMTATKPTPLTTRKMLGTTPVLTQQDSISRVGSCPAASAATVSSMTVIAGRFVDGANVATVRDAALTGLSAVRLRLVPVVPVPVVLVPVVLVPVVLVPAAATIKGLALGASSAPRTCISLVGSPLMLHRQWPLLVSAVRPPQSRAAIEDESGIEEVEDMEGITGRTRPPLPRPLIKMAKELMLPSRAITMR